MAEQAGTPGKRPGRGTQDTTSGSPDRMVRPAAPRPTAAAMALTPKEIIGILRRHVLLIICMTILGFIGGGVAWFLLLKFYPKYTASTYIEVLPPIKVDPMQIGAPQANKDIAYQFRFSMAALMKQQSSLQNLLRNDKVRATKWFQSFDNDIEQIEDLRDNLGVGAQRESQYIAISMTCGDSKESALIVNEMIGQFLTSRAVSTTGEIKGKLKQLRKQEAGLQRELDFAEAQLKEVRDTSGMMMLGIGQQWQHTVTRRLADLEIRKNEVQTRVSQLEASLETFEERLRGPVSTQDQLAVEADPIIVSLNRTLTMLEVDLARKLQYLGENHRGVRQTREVISQTKQERLQRHREISELRRVSNYKNAMDAMRILQNELEVLEQDRMEAEKEQKKLDAWNSLYEQRLVIRDQREGELNLVKEQIGKYEVLHDDPETPKVRLTGWAPEPLRVSSPRLEFYIPGGTIMGFMLGVGLCFLIELLNDLVRTPSDVGKYLHIPLLGMICHAEEDDEVEGVDLCHVVRQAPFSITSECYRRLRANLKLSSPAEALKAILVTSGSAGDGKTCTATNLATALVAEDKTVLLIDANFRKPMLSVLFPRQAEPFSDTAPDGGEENHPVENNRYWGLSNLLTGQCSYEDVIRPSGIGGLDIIDSGPLPSNPAELLGSARMKLLTQEQRKKYDHIIVDGPPVLLVSEAKILAADVDSVILVLNADSTRRGVAQRTIRELRVTRANLIGCVLLGVRALKGGYFHELIKSYQEYQAAQLAEVIQ